jgi:tetratricopeptide (TPR) repeat protein
MDCANRRHIGRLLSRRSTAPGVQQGGRKVRKTAIGFVLMLSVLPAWAQTDIERCLGHDTEVSISGCTAVILSKGKGLPNFLLQDAYRRRGLVYLQQKKLYDEAIADLTSTIALKPEPQDMAVAYTLRGIAYYMKHLFDKAIADTTQAIAIAPDYADAYNVRGQAYELAGQPDKAIADYRTVLKIEPNTKNAKDGLTRLGGKP